MAKAIEDLFIYLLFLTDILLIIFYFIFFRENRTEKGLLAIISYCFIDLTVNFLTESSYASRSVMAVAYSLFTFIEYALFAYFIWLNIKQIQFRRYLIIVSIIFSIFLAIYDTVTKSRSLDSIPIGIETILILIYIFYYLFEQANDKTNLFIYSHYQFWVVTGIMIYLAGSFFVYIFANQIDKSLLDRYWSLTNALYILKNMFFFIAFFLNIRKHKQHLNPKKFRPYLN